MSIRTAETIWNGNLREGNGTMKVGSGVFEAPFTWGTRFSEDPGTNPEEVVGAALSGCFSMFLSAQLTGNKTPPESIHTNATVHFGRDETGPLIEKIVLETIAYVSGVSQERFDELVGISKQNCPISRALRAVEIEVHAKMNG